MGSKIHMVVPGIVVAAALMALMITPAQPVSAQDADDMGVDPTAAEEEVLDPEDTDDMAVEELDDIMIAFGTVTAVAEDSLTILEYDFDTDQDIEVVYAVDEKTEYENVTRVSGLAPDDPVEIIYLEMDDQRVALVVTREELDMEEELSPEAGEGEEIMPEDIPPEEDLP